MTLRPGPREGLQPLQPHEKTTATNETNVMAALAEFSTVVFPQQLKKLFRSGGWSLLNVGQVARCFADEQPASADELLAAVNPDIEILMCLVAREGNVHALNHLTPSGRGEEEGA